MNGTFIIAMVFGISMGVLYLIAGSFLPAFFMFGLVAFLMALRHASDPSARLLLGSIAAAICSGGFIFYAARSEITGKAVDYHTYGRVIVGSPVTREESPQKFREATNYKWGLGIVCVSIGAGCFMFRRKLDSPDLF
jgi:ABC-type Fe3+-siderophore transport system permease subunit